MKDNFAPISGEPGDTLTTLSEGEKYPVDDLETGSFETEKLPVDLSDQEIVEPDRSLLLFISGADNQAEIVEESIKHAKEASWM
ncbi:hypothetical protein LOK49_LG01G01154 [Camellia lanceoleosa]|uniref:Uncharacterized protein n=1 Tax=Camellia lanceoleosa TaxID=1840588 RepID=A0ACC0J520_9ERIC|nr:hypothetical protein LOK49_LG01G01154 [Camellia lanceoleosa]